MALTLYKKIDINDSKEINDEHVILVINQQGRDIGKAVNMEKVNDYMYALQYCIKFRDILNAIIDDVGNTSWPLINDENEDEIPRVTVRVRIGENMASVIMDMCEFDIPDSELIDEFCSILRKCDKFEFKQSPDNKDCLRLVFGVDKLFL